MARTRLTDEQVADIRAMAAESGHSLQEIGDRFGTTRQHVSRLVHGEQRATLPDVDVDDPTISVVDAVVALLAYADRDPSEDVMAATAVCLAEKLDAVRRSNTAQSAMAAPGLVRTLSETLADLRGTGWYDLPRLGALRGDEAVLVARELGYPDPEAVDIESFDGLEVIRLRRVGRLAAQAQAQERPDGTGA
jgi:hypothetical protein